MLRIGLFGGTFNPPHLGHLLLAEGAREALGLDEVLWIPAHLPPHKPVEGNVSAEERCQLVERAIEGHPHFKICRLELERPPPSYTIDTVLKLQAERPGNEWFFLLGAEAAEQLPTWRQADRLLSLVRFAAVPRPGHPPGKLPPGVETIAVKTLDLSASEIRRRIREGRDIRDLVPDPVRRMIEEKGLYRS